MNRVVTFELTKEAHVEIEEIRFQANQLTRADVDEVRVDVGRVELLDSMLLGQLVRLTLALKAREIPLRLMGLSFYGRTVIHRANLDGIFGLEMPEPPRWESMTAL